MQEWATNAGVQTSDGFELTSFDGKDYYAMTQQNVPAGSPVMYVPEGMIFVPYGPPTCQLMGGSTDGTGMPTSKGWEVEIEPVGGAKPEANSE